MMPRTRREGTVMRVWVLTFVMFLVHGMTYAADWTVLEPGERKGRGTVVREKASLQEAEAGSRESSEAAKEAAEAEIPSGPQYQGRQENWTVLESDEPDGRSKVVRERATVEEAEAAAPEPVETEVRVVPHAAGGDIIYTPEVAPEPERTGGDYQ